MTSAPTRPTQAQIERAWRGLPIGEPEEDEGPPAPVLSPTARRNNWWLAGLAVGLVVCAVVDAALTSQPRFTFVAIGVAQIVLVLIGLRTQRMLGLVVRGRLIARREHEPLHYWASLALLAFFGAIWSLVGAETLFSR